MEDKKFRLIPFDTSFVPAEWIKLITAMLEKNNYQVQDVNHFFFSQFSKKYTEEMFETLGLSDDYQTYVGDKYGYTGVTSPFVSLHDALEAKKLKDGDNIIFVSVGAGYNIVSILYKI